MVIIILILVMYTLMETKTKMTTLTLSLSYPLIRKQVILATFQCESENSESAELFWKCWNDALNEDGDAHRFNPTGIILDERSGSWKAIENIFVKEFLRRSFSCEFHFKQSVTRRLNDAMFLDVRGNEFRSISKEKSRTYQVLRVLLRK